jgi:triosephosphate isomerase (TIM)
LIQGLDSTETYRIMRRKIVAGNWKMNKSLQEAEALCQELSAGMIKGSSTTVILCPPFPYLAPLKAMLTGTTGIELASQNCAAHSSGAYTGEVSAAMIASCGAQWTLIGHSERRTIFAETAPVLVQKMGEAFKAGLSVIWCCGEQLPERNANLHFEIVRRQMMEELAQCTNEQLRHLVIAYEPVWAIGTGLTASPDQAQEMHAFIRKVLTEMFGSAVAEQTSILYGGSCNAGNAATLFALQDVDGGLIGGASLQADQFLTIISSMKA